MPFEIFSIVSDGKRYNCNCTVESPALAPVEPSVPPLAPTPLPSSGVVPLVQGTAQLDRMAGIGAQSPTEGAGGQPPATGGGGGGAFFPHGSPVCGAGASDFSNRVIPGGFKNPNLALTSKDTTGRNEYVGVRRGDGRFQTTTEYWNEIVTEAGLRPGPVFGSVDCGAKCPPNVTDLVLKSAMANSDRQNIYLGERSKMEKGGDCYGGGDRVVR